MADARLERGPLSSRVIRVTGGTAHVEASDPILAQELRLRGDALVWAVNARMRGRPGATIELRTTGRFGGSRSRADPVPIIAVPARTTHDPGQRHEQPLHDQDRAAIRRRAAGRRVRRRRFHEPSIGAQARTKGSLFLLAQLTGGNPRSPAAPRGARRDPARLLLRPLGGGARRAVEGARRPPTGASTTSGGGWASRAAPASASSRSSSAGARPTSPRSVRRARSSSATGGCTSPATAGRRREEDPRVRRRAWRPPSARRSRSSPSPGRVLAAGDRIALVSRHFAHTVGVDELKRRSADAAGRRRRAPPAGLRDPRRRGSDGLLAIEIAELAATETRHQLEPVRAAEPFAGLPDQSPVPLADAIGRGLHRAGDAAEGRRAAFGRGAADPPVVDPGVRPAPAARVPAQHPAHVGARAGAAAAAGMAGMGLVAGILAIGLMVAALPTPRPTDAIPRAATRPRGDPRGCDLIGEVEERVEGADLVDRDPERAGSSGRCPRRRRAGRRRRRRRTRARPAAAPDRAAASTPSTASRVSGHRRRGRPRRGARGGRPRRHGGRQRRLAVGPRLRPRPDHPRRPGRRVDGSHLPRRRGLGSGDVPGDPWLIATAATDVVVIDHQRAAWRIDLAERIPRRCARTASSALGPGDDAHRRLQHRPPLEIFNLYVVDARAAVILRWSPPAVIPVNYPDPPEPFLTEEPDLRPATRARPARRRQRLAPPRRHGHARRLRVAARAGRLLARPAARRRRPPRLDYRLLDGATVGDREFLYVYDAANARIIAFQRADGAFVRQWLAPSSGPLGDLLDDVAGSTSPR